MEGSNRPRRQLTGLNYHVPDEDLLEWEESDVVRSERKRDSTLQVVSDSEHGSDSSSDQSESDTSQSDSEDGEETGKGTSDPSFLASINDKMTRWGAFKKDWTGTTDLEQYLRAQPQKGIKQLKHLVESLRRGVSIEDFEKQIPPATVTKFYWSLKKDLERLKGQRVVLLIGFCPQYEIALNGNIAEVAPEDSECLTQLLVSWLARQSDGLLLAWDFRHDCRKHAKPISSKTAYAKCAPIDKLKTETEQLNYLSYILLLVAEKLYSIEFQGTISFSACTNQFVRLLNVPHITLDEHISRISKRPMLAVDLVRGMVDSRLYGDQQEKDLWNSLTAFLLLGPGRESGRALVRLPPRGQESAAPITFEELISLSTTERKDYGRSASAKGRRKTKEREANDPAALRDKKNETQRNLRAKNPGYASASNEKVAQKRLDDPEFDEMYRERKKRIDKKYKDKVRGKN
ncbi:hypothetical protein IFR04_009331 [Cadophora malorum]|uniref:Uncharacterized protein n=1 Tax=Cadophora malorum TaxID=108018 RepID=A0A8H7TCU9_9HELO|nr:hypothetical protein IFR04_009331 [Cadophora malorum]